MIQINFIMIVFSIDLGAFEGSGQELRRWQQRRHEHRSKSFDRIRKSWHSLCQVWQTFVPSRIPAAPRNGTGRDHIRVEPISMSFR